MTKRREKHNRLVFSGRETARRRALDGIRRAGFGQRLFGYAIDLVLAVLMWAPLEIAWRLFVLREQDVHITWDFHEAGNIIVVLLYHGMFNYFGNGRTPGKWLAGTRVVSLTRERIGPWQAVERALGYGAAVMRRSPCSPVA